MNITTSTSSSEVNTTSSQTKTSSSAKTSDKSFDEEMISQQVETQETTSLSPQSSHSLKTNRLK